MTFDFSSALRYWRTSLADGALGEGKFSQRERDKYLELSPEDVKLGQVPEAVVKQLFKDVPKTAMELCLEMGDGV